MTYIKQCEAPDISDLGDNLLSRFVSRFFLDVLNVPGTASASRLLTGFLMVTDKAVREYAAGRKTLVAYADGGDIAMIAEGLGHFETCINSLMRAFHFLDEMQAYSESPAFNGNRRQIIETCNLDVTPVRRVLRQIAKDIVATNVADTTHLLAINHDGTELGIGDHGLALIDVAGSLRRLHETGCTLIEDAWDIDT